MPLSPLEIELRWQDRLLPNGLRIVHVPTMPTDQRAYLGAIVRAGSRHESKLPAGTAHFLEHMMFRGSSKYPSFEQLADAFEWLGGEWNAETGHEGMEYSFIGDETGVLPAIDLFADFMKCPQLCDLERERQVILREIDEEINEFGHSTDIDEHIARIFWQGCGLASPVAGTSDSVRQIGLQHLQNFRERYYTTDRISVVVASRHDSAQVLERLECGFHDYPVRTGVPEKDMPEPFRGPQVQLVEHTDTQYHVALCFVCEGERSPRTPAYELISRVLVDGYSARFPKRLREELGLVYDVDASLSQHSDCGTFDVSALVRPTQVEDFVREVLLCLQDLTTKGPSEAELAKALQRCRVDLRLFSSQPESVGYRIGWNLLTGQDPRLGSEWQRFAELEPEDIRIEASRLFDRRQLGCVLLGPKNPALVERVRTLLDK